MFESRFINRVKRFSLKTEKIFIDSIRSSSLIIIALLIFISGSGIKLSMHFCQHQLYDIGILSNAESCMLDGKHQHNTCCQEKEKSHSCEDEDIVFNKVDNYLISSVNFDFQSYLNTFFAVYELHTVSEFIVLNSTLKNKYLADISPPDIATLLSKLQAYLL
ncbi:MAG: hypothetical protein C0595_04650 [Marinilabiliales bacterium]|nr:MAG: hypothetical protein C0595_04650 [Marinilabiliales bacterium]